MNVAYDLRYAVDHFGGIGTHAYALLDAMLGLAGDHRFTVLWNPALPHRRYDFDAIRRDPRVTWVERPWPTIPPAHLLPLGAWLRGVRPAAYLSPYFLRPVAPGCPVLLTIHDVWPLRLPEGLTPLNRVLYRASLRWAAGASRIVTSSEFSRREIVELVGVPESRVVAIPLGVPPQAPAALARRPESLPDGPFALVVGDNRPRKNLAVLARAWARMGGRAPWRLVSAGKEEGRYPGLLELTRAAGGTAERVTPLGWVTESELAWLYSHAESILFPSRYEGFGFPIVEAFARGTPVIAADTPTFREVAADAACFVDPDDADGWVAAIGAGVALAAGARGIVRDRGLERARSLSYRATAERTLAVVREVARAAGRG